MIKKVTEDRNLSRPKSWWNFEMGASLINLLSAIQTAMMSNRHSHASLQSREESGRASLKGSMDLEFESWLGTRYSFFRLRSQARPRPGQSLKKTYLYNKICPYFVSQLMQNCPSHEVLLFHIPARIKPIFNSSQWCHNLYLMDWIKTRVIFRFVQFKQVAALHLVFLDFSCPVWFWSQL